MPTQNNPLPDTVELLIGGQMQGDWSGYEVDSDLLTPADAWQVTLGMSMNLLAGHPSAGQMPPDVAAGAPVVVKISGDTVMTGRIDEVNHQVNKSSHTLTISGRDGAAVLLDCSAPIFTAQMASLQEIVTKVVRPLGITKIRLDAAAIRTREKISVEPGDSAWDVLSHAAEANGLWPWFEPDGTLVIGGPDYSQPVSATLVLRRDGIGNNVLSLDKTESVAERYSQVTVLGQTHSTSLEQGKNALQATEKDSGMSWYRPKIITDHEADNAAICRDRARKLISDSRLKGLTLTATVQGHRITSTDGAGNGMLWTPGQRIYVVSEPHGIAAIYFLMARKFTRSRNEGTRTTLTLKEDGAWLLDAHPHKNKHRRGKNDSTPHMQISDATQP